MDQAIIYISFIPWLFYFISYSIKGIKDTKGVKRKKYVNWLKTHLLQIFRLDTLVLIAVFLYFTKHNNDFVDKTLFFAINLYLFVNSIYDKSFKNKNKVKWSEATLVIILLIITALPFAYYEYSANVQLTYKLMFSYTFFAYILVIFAKLVNMPIVRLYNKLKKSTTEERD